MADEVVDTPFGKFLVNPNECIGSTVKAGTVWDGPGFLQVIAREHGQLGTPGVSILDIGAHLGDWTIWLCGQGAWRVVACEPAPVMLNYLKANLDLNKPICADRVVVLPVAAYDRQTLLRWTVEYNPQDSGGAALQPAVPGPFREDLIQAAPLDDYRYLFGEGVSLIKVDAQGSDLRALEGLEQTILKDYPVIVFEWEAELAKAHGDTLEQAKQFLDTFGYSVHEWPSHPNNYLALPRAKEKL